MNRSALHARKEGQRFYSNEEWKGMERGWVHGEKEFRERMLEHLNPDSDHPPRQIYDAAQKRDMSEVAVEATIERGLKRLKVDPSELKTLRKSHPAKLMLATYLKTHYSIGNTRISEVLHMGHASLVGRCHTLITDNRDLNRKYETFSRYLDIEYTV